MQDVINPIMKTSYETTLDADSSLKQLLDTLDPSTKPETQDENRKVVRTLGEYDTALDLETECAIKTCIGFGGYTKCRHALNPKTNRITKIAVWHPNHKHVFNNVEEFERWENATNYKYLYFGQTLKFDFQQLAHHSRKRPLHAWVHDTEIMAHVHTTKVTEDWLAWYDEERKLRAKSTGIHYRKAGGLSLKTLAPFFLGVDPFWETADLADDAYVLKDVEYTYRLAEYFLQNMTDDEYSFYETKALPWAKMLFEAEQRGVLMDVQGLKDFKEELKETIEVLAEKLDEAWDHAHKAYQDKQMTELDYYYDNMKNQKIAARNRQTAYKKIEQKINFASPTQMTWLLRDYLGHDITTFEGEESTGRGTLERLASQGNEDIKLYLEWRETEKMLNAFVIPYLELLTDPTSDGALHPTFRSTGTKTGRLSCADPNLQQVTKELKKFFIARPGYKFVNYDLSAIEAKLIAWYSEDPSLCEVILNGWSIHDLNVKVFFGAAEPIPEIKALYPDQRNTAKTVGFSLFYGAGPNRIRETFMQAGVPITQTDARGKHQAFKQTYAGALNFHGDVTRRFENGEVIINAIGRPIAIQSWENSYMQGFNRLVQSTASDINLEIAYNVTKRAREMDMDCTPILFVHDNNVWEVRENDAKILELLVLEAFAKYNLMTQFGVIKITGEGEISETWS